VKRGGHSPRWAAEPEREREKKIIGKRPIEGLIVYGKIILIWIIEV
jgi:hypothetical protein